VVSRVRVLFEVVELSENEWDISDCEFRDDVDVEEVIESELLSSGLEVYAGCRDDE
jgi:hypothetical protein